MVGFLGILLLFQMALLCFLAFRERRRRCEIQSLTLRLERLLHDGEMLPMEEYREGELSILANQIQKLALKLTESADRLQVEKAYLADSLADISHQLRTPMTAMNLSLSLLADPDLPETQRRQHVAELLGQLRRMDWLVETLLKLSRLDADMVQMEEESFPVSELVRRAAAPIAVSVELRGQRLTMDCGEAALTGDLSWTTEALGNLLKNASEHTPEGGVITVRVEENPLFTQITVENTGAGFAPEDLPHLFERFYRGKNAQEGSCSILRWRLVIRPFMRSLRRFLQRDGCRKMAARFS
ncbi:MAG: HAMP domain-containing histidine kinase [Lachnospiraceae bacterium]|nr:HAMP domain-containing histidine kinase [Lachnospiraceae bacterium]